MVSVGWINKMKSMAIMGAQNRRSILKAIRSAGLMSVLPEAGPYLGMAEGRVLQEMADPGMDAQAKPKYSLKFAVIGLDHNHILGMTAAIQRGGGELVCVHSSNAEAIADFQNRFGKVKVAKSEDEILNDPSIKLVAAAPIPDQRAPLGIRVMRHGKDYLSDKPAIITLDQLAEVRTAIKETGRIFAIMYSSDWR
jgi:hypothetical protein